MTSLHQEFLDIEALAQEQDALSSRSKELERQARAASQRTTNLARKLFVAATLRLIADRVTVDTCSLQKQIAELAGELDRFAVELCDDWLVATRSTTSEDPEQAA